MPKGAHKGSQHHFAKLTEELVADARAWYFDEPDPISIAELARYYNVSDSAMGNAIKGRTWKHVKENKAIDD